MTGTESILKNIKQEIETKTSTRFICCGECNGATTHDLNRPLPAACPTCKAVDPMWGVGITYGESKANLACRQPTAAPTEPEPKPAAPAPAPKVEPKPAAPAPKAKRARPAATAPAPEPTPAPATDEPLVEVSEGGTDFRAKRLEATNNLITTHQLNGVQFKKVGVAEVFGYGFTQWVDGLPAYTLMEPFDTAFSFRQVLSEARKLDGKITVDVAALTGIPTEIATCCFQGQLIAGLMADTGPIRVQAGDRVEVGARVSRSGGLIFRVLKKL